MFTNNCRQSRQGGEKPYISKNFTVNYGYPVDKKSTLNLGARVIKAITNRVFKSVRQFTS